MEITFYVLWSYPSSVVVWQECSGKVHKLSLLEFEGMSFVKELTEKLDDDAFMEVMFVARLIWMRRNAVVFRKEFQSLSQVVFAAKEAKEEFSQATQLLAQVKGAICQIRRCKAPMGMVKINWDAVVSFQDKMVGMVKIIWDAAISI